jgi:hypothetical protein
MKSIPLKRFAVALGGAAVLLGASLGLSYAQSATPSPAAQHKRAIIDDAAAKLGISGDDLAQALKESRKELGQKRGVQVAKLVHDELEVAARALGLADAKALRQELRGSTLTAVAQQHNVAPATVATALKTDLNAKIDALVSSGKLKAERAAAVKTRVSERVDALMTREFKAGRTAR